MQLRCLASHQRFNSSKSEFVAHPDQLKYVRFWSRALPEFFEGARVLEIGSLNINGSVRQFFSRGDYLGIDVGDGPGVDQVAGGHEIEGPDASFDVVISCECMEHNPFWAETIENMIRLLRPGGLIVMTFAGYGRPAHGLPEVWPDASPLTVREGWNYYRNLGRAEMASVGGLRSQIDPLYFGENASFCDFYVAGIKKGMPAAGTHGALRSREESIAHFLSAERRVRRWLRHKNRPWRYRSRRLASRLAGERGVHLCRRIEQWLDPEFKHEALSLPDPSVQVETPTHSNRRRSRP